jgi:hypothetical protein
MASRQPSRASNRPTQNQQTSTDEDLSQLEKDIRQLKIEYEQYFGGGKSRPPVEIEWRIDTMMKRYADRSASMNFSQRFRYSNLAQTSVKYRDIFRKRLKQREEGTVQRHFGAAAREIEKERARKRSAGKPAAQFPFSITYKDSGHEEKKVEQLYKAFRLAKDQAGEPTDRLTLETFQEFVHQKAQQLKKQKNAHEIEYVVEIEGEHARLKARVKS